MQWRKGKKRLIELEIPNGYEEEEMLDTNGAEYESEEADEEREVILRFEGREKAGR